MWHQPRWQLPHLPILQLSPVALQMLPSSKFLGNVPNAALPKAPTTITIGAAMDACEVQWRLVLHLFQDLAHRELEKSDMTYKFAVSAASKGLLWDVGFILLAGMIASAVEQDVLCFSAAAASCQKRWKAGLEVLSCMSSKMLQQDVVTLSYAVTACVKGGFYRVEFDTLQALVLRLLQPGEASEGQP